MDSPLASKSPSSDRVSSNLNGCSHIVSSNLIGCSHILFILSFITNHTFYLVITYIKLPLPPHDAMIVGLQDRSPSICYPTLPMLILRQVPVGMHTPIPNPMIKTSRKDMEGRDSQVLRQTYAHILVCGTPPS